MSAPAAPAATEDSLGTPVRVEPATDDAPAVPAPPRSTSPRHRPWHDQPRFVMARSLVVPGWGQLHNRAWIKALLVAGGEGWLGARIVQDQRELDRLLSQLDEVRRAGNLPREAELVNEYNARLDQRLGRQWMLGAVVAYALVDAFVDANFRGFDVEFRNDPALPAGASPAVPVGGGGGPGVRLALRWDF